MTGPLLDGPGLKEIRRRLGLDQRAMGEAIGVTQTWIGQMERGKAAIERRTALAILHLRDNPHLVGDAAADLPGPRPVEEVLSECSDMLAAIRGGSTIEAADLCGQVLSLMLELRVPRMPDDPTALAAMLDDARSSGRTYATDEVRTHLEESSKRFGRALTAFRMLLAEGSVDLAAAMLMPGGPLLRWGADVVVRNAEERVVLVAGGSEASSDDPRPGIAILDAVLETHLAVREVWER